MVNSNFSADILRNLKCRCLSVSCFDSLPSTNTYLRELAEHSNIQEGTVIVAKHQSQGRGRMGRSFFSPDSTGLYMSLFLRPKLGIKSAVKITAAAAVAVSKAIEDTSGKATGIKWLNDILIDGRKVSGILAEGILSSMSDSYDYIILGIGVNLAPPPGGFPDDIKESAGAVYDSLQPGTLEKLSACILDTFWDFYEALPEVRFFDEYVKRSLSLERDIWVINGDNLKMAHSLSINDDFTLQVISPDGSYEDLSSGEVSTRFL